jgi:hypothetical protein
MFENEAGYRQRYLRSTKDEDESQAVERLTKMGWNMEVPYTTADEGEIILFVAPDDPTKPQTRQQVEGVPAEPPATPDEQEELEGAEEETG